MEVRKLRSGPCAPVPPHADALSSPVHHADCRCWRPPLPFPTCQRLKHMILGFMPILPGMYPSEKHMVHASPSLMHADPPRNALSKSPSKVKQLVLCLSHHHTPWADVGCIDALPSCRTGGFHTVHHLNAPTNAGLLPDAQLVLPALCLTQMTSPARVPSQQKAGADVLSRPCPCRWVMLTSYHSLHNVCTLCPPLPLPMSFLRIA